MQVGKRRKQELRPHRKFACCHWSLEVLGPAREAHQFVFAMCYLLCQVAALDVVVTDTADNRLGNALWDLPCMQALMARSVVFDVSYCLYGCDLPKCTSSFNGL